MNLTETARFTKKFLVSFFLFIILMIILKNGWDIGLRYWTVKNPPKPIPPTMAFGKLPAPVFKAASFSALPSFTLNTIEGLPSSSPSAKVFLMKKTGARLGGLENLKKQVAYWEFTAEPAMISKSSYRFSDPKIPGRTLEINTSLQNFLLKYTPEKDEDLTSQKSAMEEAKAIDSFKWFLQKASFFKKEWEGSKNFKTTYLKSLGGGNYMTAISQAASDALRIDFFDNNAFGGMPVVSSTPFHSNIWAILSGSPTEIKRFLEFHYDLWLPEEETWATYPIKTMSAAWEELRNGKAVIINGSQNTKTVSINKIYLAYFNPPETHDYLEPIYVFEGEGEFAAYLAAIEPDWLSSQTPR